MKKLTPNLLRVQRFSCTVFFLAMFYCTTGFAQSNNFSKELIDKCIVEVYQDKADELIFESSSNRYAYLSDFLRSQISIEYHPEFSGKGFDSTNSLPLNNKYNSSLQYDSTYDQNNFNPLKYSFPMNPHKKIMYRIGNSDYLMIVYPTK